jgi:hypothetical protein
MFVVLTIVRGLMGGGRRRHPSQPAASSVRFLRHHELRADRRRAALERPWARWHRTAPEVQLNQVEIRRDGIGIYVGDQDRDPSSVPVRVKKEVVSVGLHQEGRSGVVRHWTVVSDELTTYH